ncbi:hypothetical protein M3202_19650 [Alkalihalobacillus oceani]|uniref:Uncharacterized protein n=1 Tax=Halalkalibacter oceani TaxID=1653776 RepID=A0A9X2DVF4_9BACI|nr:hypothetical protein [Halalkalibacter oceani]MCM3716262.1 hypothetical protein [Halalkalibacter oceani]
MENTLEFLKGKLSLKGDKWKNTKDEDYMRDCLALIEAINALESRLYGEKITDITFIL